MMDLKGIWRTRSGDTATILGQHNGNWQGEIVTKSNNNTKVEEHISFTSWDENGIERSGTPEWDLMERLSDKWSSERALG